MQNQLRRLLNIQYCYLGRLYTYLHLTMQGNFARRGIKKVDYKHSSCWRRKDWERLKPTPFLVRRQRYICTCTYQCTHNNDFRLTAHTFVCSYHRVSFFWPLQICGLCGFRTSTKFVSLKISRNSIMTQKRGLPFS